MQELIYALRSFEGSIGHANRDFTVCEEAADALEQQAARIAELKIERDTLIHGLRLANARVTDLEAQLAAMKQQEPIGVIRESLFEAQITTIIDWLKPIDGLRVGTKLYATPQDAPVMRELSDEEICSFWKEGQTIPEFVRACIAASRTAGQDKRNTVEDLIQRHRISIVPEYEGGYHAAIYKEESEPISTGYGNTPREAIDKAMQQAGEQKGGA